MEGSLLTDYRKVPDNQREKFHRMLHYAFQPHEEPPDYNEEDDFRSGVGDRRGVSEDGQLKTICSIHQFEAHLQGSWLPMGGVSGVATPPEYRHRGYVRDLISFLLRELQTEGVLLSALWPFSYAFYNKLGYRLSDRFRRLTLDPENLEFANNNSSGTFRSLSMENYRELQRVYLNFARQFNLPLHRDENWWDKHKINTWRGPTYCYGWQFEDELQGYLLYTVTGDKQREKKELEVREFVYRNQRAFYQLLWFLYSHASQAGQTSFSTPFPKNLSLLDLVEDPRSVDVKNKPGVMVRCVDVEEGLQALSFPDDLTGKATLKVTDPVLETNNATFAIEFPAGTAKLQVEKIDQPSCSADFSLDIGTFSQIYTGYLPPERAAAAKQLTVNNEEKMKLLRRAFPERETYFNDQF